MLIECNYCGAPLDVGANAELVRCKYCDTTTRVQATRTVAAETPRGWQPPRQWIPPAHVPADSAVTLVYHAVGAVRKIISLAVGLVFLGVAISIGAWLYTQQASAGAADVRGALQAAERAVNDAKRAAEGMSAGALASEDLFAGDHAKNLVTKFSAQLGGKPVRALELVLYPEYAILQAQDPRNPRHVDRYLYRSGTISAAEPVNVQSLVHGRLEEHLVSLDEVRLEKLPELVAGTLGTLGYENAKVSHVIIERNLPFSKQVVIRVYASGPRESGRVDYTGAGAVLRVYK